MGRRPEGSVFKRPGSHYYYTASAKYRLKPESAKTDSKAEAAEILRARIEEVKRGLRPDAAKIKFAELIYDKLASMLINKRSSYRNAKIRATKHILPFFGNSRALDVTPYRINTDFVNHRAKQRYGKKKIFKPVSNSEINRELDLIRSAFRLGLKNGKVQIVPHVARLKEPEARSGFFEWKQFQTLLKFLPQPVAQLCKFYYVTGWRREEGLNAVWPWVSFETRRITLPGEFTKNGKPRVFPFTSALEQLLKEQTENRVELCPYIFHREGKQIREFKRSWKTACKKAGLAGSIVHSFRRTAVRNLELAGVPRKVAMQMVGMETESIYSRYRIVAEQELQDAAEKINRFEKTQYTIQHTISKSKRR